MQIRKTLYILLFAFFGFGCQTPPLKDYKRLTLGMEKHDVLEIMGNPTRTQRWQGKDRWTYIFYDSGIRLEKEVHFFENTSVYVGEPLKPEVSAEEQDKINELKNRTQPKDYVNFVLEKERDKIKSQKYDSSEDRQKPPPAFVPVQ